MKQFFTTKRICRAGIIAALYVAFTYAFGAIAYEGYLEIRPAEALTILPLFFPEAVPALYIGCMLANLGSPFLVYDVFIGSLATLLAALATWGVGKLIRSHAARVAVGGIFPVLFNAFCIPLIIVFLCDTLVAETAAASYWFFVGSLAATQVLWVYALGVPSCLRQATSPYTGEAIIREARRMANALLRRGRQGVRGYFPARVW